MLGKGFKKIICSFALMAFTAMSVVPPSYAQAVMADLPKAGSMVDLSQGFAPVILRGMKVDALDPFKFEFVLDPGQSGLEGDALKDESTRLIRYFLASVTTPDQDLWVNLSPYEQDRIIPEAFGTTEMGRDLLAQDYILKQVTSSLMYPDGETGKAFWQKVYAKAYDAYGTTDVPVDTFNKVWIAPDMAEVYEDNGVAFIGESHLKVMLESDYLAANKTNAEASNPISATSVQPASETQEMTKEIIREVMLPVIEREVNEGRNFAQLRQVYQSLILAAWYKKRLKDSLLSQVYADRNKVSGVDIQDKKESEKIWAQYVDAFKKGAYNYIKEEYDQYTQELIPRKYFSGGMKMKVDIFSKPMALLKEKLSKVNFKSNLLIVMAGLTLLNATVFANRTYANGSTEAGSKEIVMSGENASGAESDVNTFKMDGDKDLGKAGSEALAPLPAVLKPYQEKINKQLDEFDLTSTYTIIDRNVPWEQMSNGVQKGKFWFDDKHYLELQVDDRGRITPHIGSKALEENNKSAVVLSYLVKEGQQWTDMIAPVKDLGPKDIGGAYLDAEAFQDFLATPLQHGDEAGIPLKNSLTNKAVGQIVFFLAREDNESKLFFKLRSLNGLEEFSFSGVENNRALKVFAESLLIGVNGIATIPAMGGDLLVGMAGEVATYDNTKKTTGRIYDKSNEIKKLLKKVGGRWGTLDRTYKIPVKLLPYMVSSFMFVDALQNEMQAAVKDSLGQMYLDGLSKKVIPSIFGERVKEKNDPWSDVKEGFSFDGHSAYYRTPMTAKDVVVGGVVKSPVLTFHHEQDGTITQGVEVVALVYDGSASLRLGGETAWKARNQKYLEHLYTLRDLGFKGKISIVDVKKEDPKKGKKNLEVELDLESAIKYIEAKKYDPVGATFLFDAFDQILKKYSSGNLRVVYFGDVADSPYANSNENSATGVIEDRFAQTMANVQKMPNTFFFIGLDQQGVEPTFLSLMDKEMNEKGKASFVQYARDDGRGELNAAISDLYREAQGPWMIRLPSSAAIEGTRFNIMGEDGKVLKQYDRTGEEISADAVKDIIPQGVAWSVGEDVVMNADSINMLSGTSDVKQTDVYFIAQDQQFNMGLEKQGIARIPILDISGSMTGYLAVMKRMVEKMNIRAFTVLSQNKAYMVTGDTWEEIKAKLDKLEEGGSTSGDDAVETSINWAIDYKKAHPEDKKIMRVSLVSDVGFNINLIQDYLKNYINDMRQYGIEFEVFTSGRMYNVFLNDLFEVSVVEQAAENLAGNTTARWPLLVGMTQQTDDPHMHGLGENAVQSLDLYMSAVGKLDLEAYNKLVTEVRVVRTFTDDHKEYTAHKVLHDVNPNVQSLAPQLLAQEFYKLNKPVVMKSLEARLYTMLRHDLPPSSLKGVVSNYLQFADAMVEAGYSPAYLLAMAEGKDMGLEKDPFFTGLLEGIKGSEERGKRIVMWRNSGSKMTKEVVGKFGFDSGTPLYASLSGLVDQVGGAGVDPFFMTPDVFFLDPSSLVIKDYAENGGIDLNTSTMNLSIKGDGSANINAVDPAMIAQFQAATGLVPVIISITPANNLPAFLGLSSLDDPEPTTQAST